MISGEQLAGFAVAASVLIVILGPSVVAGPAWWPDRPGDRRGRQPSSSGRASTTMAQSGPAGSISV